MNQLIVKYFRFSFFSLFVGLIFGFIYSLNLLGITIDSAILNPSLSRSVHISLMLYGFIPLMLSYLPFLIIDREIGSDFKALKYLEIYSILWLIFLLFMVVSILFGNVRGLAFYDFAYELNFILALAGGFYIVALYKSIKNYKVLPLWVKISLVVVVIAPFLLLLLMNPKIGQVEATIYGPHGDNTLGMSLALIPIYYLIIKYLSKDNFVAKWHIFWITPLFFYLLSILYRSYIGELSYKMEWFFQYLTLLYIPLLYRWYRDSNIDFLAKKFLLISICGFLFVDIEGNILFIESIRWIFHRNNLIVGHAHIALGIALGFMVFAIYSNLIQELFAKIYLFALIVIATALSIVGFIEVNWLNLNIEIFWIIRSLAGFILILSFGIYLNLNSFKHYSNLQKYNLIGCLSDGFGGILLILTASFIYPLLNFRFDGIYEYIVFGFVSITGLIHYFAIKNDSLSIVTALARLLISSLFFALYLSNRLGIEALGIALYDFIYSLVYFVIFYKGVKYV